MLIDRLRSIMVLPPFREGPSDDDGLLELHMVIDEAGGIDVIGYNIPQSTGIGAWLRLLDQFSELQHFNYIKDSACDLSRHREYLTKP